MICNELILDYGINNIISILNTNSNNDIFLFSHLNNNLIRFYENFCKYTKYDEKFLKQIKKYNKISPDLEIYDSAMIIYKTNDKIPTFINNVINEYELFKNSFEISFSCLRCFWTSNFSSCNCFCTLTRLSRSI